MKTRNPAFKQQSRRRKIFMVPTDSSLTVDTSRKDEQLRQVLDEPDRYFERAWQSAIDRAKQEPLVPQRRV